MNTITRTANNNLPAYFLGRPRSAYRVYRRPRRADAKGRVAFPGLVNPYSRLGLPEGPVGPAGATPQHLAFRRRAGMPENLLAAYAQEPPFNFSACVAPIPLGFRAIDEGDEITMAGRQWTVRIGHGHAPSHATFWSQDGLVLAGDQILPGISSNISVYPTEPEADPLGDWLESCARLRAHARPGHLVLPGHKLPFRGLGFRLTQLIENHENALARIEADLRDGPLTAAEAFPAIFKRPIGAGEYGMALGEAVAHMNHLLRRGRIARDAGAAPGGAWKFALADGQSAEIAPYSVDCGTTAQRS